MSPRILPSALYTKIEKTILSRQFIQRFSRKIIDNWINELQTCFNEEGVKALILYEPIPSNEEKYAVKLIWKCEKIGFVFVFMDGDDKVSSVEHWRVWMPRINVHKPASNTVDSTQ